jgi:hypothetical protein
MSLAKRIFLALVLTIGCIASAAAQQPRGARTIIRGGLRQEIRSDSAAMAADSLRSGVMGLDSASLAALGLDAALVDTLSADSIAARLSSLPVDSLASLMGRLPDTITIAKVDSLLADTIKPRRLDSINISKISWISAVVPGFGQIYNKQYWKLPILYSTVGAGITMGVIENKKYQDYKRQVTAITNISTTRTEELDALQTQMIRHNTRRQLYFIGAIASYIYFIGDAAVNYNGKIPASRVKKATTLSMICPGAGQIYNGSYWKAPIVIGGFASMIYVIDWNNRGYQRFRTAYNLRVDYDNALKEYNAATDKTGLTKPSPTDEFRGRYTADYLKNLKNSYRRNRDLSIIITAGVYLFNVIDAHVDAHLQDYDISDNLSMDVQPHIGNVYTAQSGSVNTYGLGINIKF